MDLILFSVFEGENWSNSVIRRDQKISQTGVLDAVIILRVVSPK